MQYVPRTNPESNGKYNKYGTGGGDGNAYGTQQREDSHGKQKSHLAILPVTLKQIIQGNMRTRKEEREYTNDYEKNW